MKLLPMFRMVYSSWLLLLSLCLLPSGSPQSFPSYTPQTYPDSMTSPSLCGMQDRTFVCDPNGILSDGNGNNISANHRQLVSLVERLFKDTRCACGPTESEHGQCMGEGGFTISVALLQRMQLDDNQHHRTAVMEAAKKFADVLRKRQERGQCDDDVLLFFSQYDHAMWTSVGKVAERYLTNELVNSIALNAENFFRKGEYTKGLNYTLTLYGQVLRGEKIDVTPPDGWYWPIPLWTIIAIGVAILVVSLCVVGLSIWACCACCHCCQKGTRREYEMGVRM